LRTQLSGRPWPLNRAVKVVSQVAEALDAAHHAGIVHRDIKPSNILVTPDLRCLVFDFGIAKPFRRDENTTGSGLIVGTPEFMSPEQCKGERIDHRSDVYSLGVMTYQMLSGHVPFSAETAVGILMKHLTEPLPVPPRGVALPPAVNGVLRKSMARDPRDRFSTAGELGEALQKSADQRATVPLHASEIRRAATPTLKLPAWVRKLRRRELRLGLAGGVLALLLGGIYAVWPRVPDVATRVAAAEVPEDAVVPPDTAPELPSEAASDTLVPPPATHEARGTDEGVAHVTATLGTLQITSNEPGKVLLDGHLIGTAPGVFESITPGSRLVALETDEGLIHEKTVIVTAGSTHHVRFDFGSDQPFATRSTEGSRVAGVSSGVTSQGRRAGRGNFERPPRIREWSGYLTDADCGVTGGKQGVLHLRCAERCIRAGQEPMLYSRGKLYRIDGFENLTVERGEPLNVRGWLELDTIHVVASE